MKKLTEGAQSNPRLRVNYDLRTSCYDQSQRMLNALEPGTSVPIHRHRDTTETLVILRGRLRELFYNDNGDLIDSFEMTAGGTCTVLQIEKGQWHSLECLESGTIIFEAKDGAYSPLTKEDILDVGR